ncbi:MAG: glycosyltransferase [Ruminococcaceae bacterium]|nr:glycosyltransferase [Oscillospiraceae bacterium]
MKVLQVNCVYRKGSTGKIMYDLHTAFEENQIDSVICYGRGEKLEGAYKTCSELYSKVNNLRSRFTGIMYGGCFFSTNRLIRIIKKERPDIVHLHCINGYFVNIYRLVTWLKKSGICTVLTLHAELMHTANCGHAFECEKWKTGCHGCERYKKETRSILLNRTHVSWKRMKKAFDGFEKLEVVSVSPWLMERAAQSPILGKLSHNVILNGIDTDTFRPSDTEELRKKYASDGEKLVFFVTAAFVTDPGHAKGGYYLLELAKRMKGEKVRFLVAAGTCEANVAWPENVMFLGSIRDQTLLAQYYAAADACLLVSKKETFSMPTAESLSCGTPVVGFEAGAPETITLKEYSRFVPYGDVDALQKALGDVLNSEKEPQIAEKAATKYNKKRMAEEYIRLYHKMLKSGENHE